MNLDSEEGRIPRSSAAACLQQTIGYAILHTINSLAVRTIPRSSAAGFIHLIQLEDLHIMNLDDHLPRMLLQYGIRVM